MFMNCTAAFLCGLLVVESGFGPGAYQHAGVPGLHGLWPEVPPYGTSACVPPANATFVPASCAYVSDARLGAHEWGKHGMCAGGPGAAVFFEQACALAAPVVAVMAAHAESWTTMKAAVLLAAVKAKWRVWAMDESEKQILVRVCSQGDGVWEWC